MEISGTAVFNDPLKTGGTLFVDGEVEILQISSGRIRLRDNRLTGNAALSTLRNRRERILALNEWMETRLDENNSADQFISRKHFESFWMPVLFPELVPARKRPPEYSAHNAQWNTADSVNWNKTWTEYLFPEELQELRNSGALIRDWEEALTWIYYEYAWDSIIASFNNTALNRIK